MIKQDSVTGIHTVCLTVIHGDPIRVKLGDGIGRTWIKRCGLFLGRFLNQTDSSDVDA